MNLKNTSGHKCNHIVPPHRNMVQVYRRFYFSFHTEYKYLTFQPHGIVGIQAEQLFINVCPDDPVFGQIDFRQIFFHKQRIILMRTKIANLKF